MRWKVSHVLSRRKDAPIRVRRLGLRSPESPFSPSSWCLACTTLDSLAMHLARPRKAHVLSLQHVSHNSPDFFFWTAFYARSQACAKTSFVTTSELIIRRLTGCSRLPA
ncbi:hypothetical protein P3342_003170 [Pyrenophora teres f. teres]|nr:hypothetical protein P3342_003170 [Pyrenophora teres f. teres]